MTTENILLLNVKLGRIQFKLFCIYRLHKHSETAFLHEFPVQLSILSYGAIAISDLNLNMLDFASTQVQNVINLMNKNSFVSLISKPTRVTSSSSLCLDHIFVMRRNINEFRVAVVD